MVEIKIGGITNIGLLRDEDEPPAVVNAMLYDQLVAEALAKEAAGEFVETDEERFARLAKEFGSA